MINGISATINWKPFTNQLIELSLGNDDSLTTLKGLGLENIPVIELSGLSSLISLEGIGRAGERKGRKRKVTVRYCDNIIDFSPLQVIDTVILQQCEGFKDIQQVNQVRDLSLFFLEKSLRNWSTIGEQTVWASGRCSITEVK